MRVRKCLFCVAGLYVGPWFVGSVLKASSERSVPSRISAVMWERCVSSASSGLSLTLSVLQKRDQKNSSWEGEGTNALCQSIGQWVTDSLNRGIDSRKEIDLWLLYIYAWTYVCVHVQQGSSGSCPTSPSFDPHFKPTFGSLTLSQVLSGGRQRQINTSGSRLPRAKSTDWLAQRHRNFKIKDRFKVKWLLDSAELSSGGRWCHWQALYCARSLVDRKRKLKLN